MYHPIYFTVIEGPSIRMSLTTGTLWHIYCCCDIAAGVFVCVRACVRVFPKVDLSPFLKQQKWFTFTGALT